MDVISISQDATKYKHFESVGKEIAMQVEGYASNERIQELHTAVQNNQYMVSADEIASAILGLAK